jgi:hypothetical protein
MIVDEGVFEPDETGAWGERVKVYCADTAGAERAMQRAVPRFRCVADEGHEYTQAEFDNVYSGIHNELLVNFVSDIEVDEDGVRFWFDTKGETTTGAAATFLRIVREELVAENIDSARVGAPDLPTA